MNQAQFDALPDFKPEEAGISVASLRDKTPRTLFYGFFSDRGGVGNLTRHIYLLEEKIHVLTHGHLEDVRTYDVLDSLKAYTVLECRRLYPAACDAEACELLIRQGVNLPFSSFQERENKPFHGKLKDELKSPPLEEIVLSYGVDSIMSLLRRAVDSLGGGFSSEINEDDQLFLSESSEALCAIRALAQGAPLEDSEKVKATFYKLTNEILVMTNANDWIEVKGNLEFFREAASSYGLILEVGPGTALD